jgi:hypothetical protein
VLLPHSLPDETPFSASIELDLDDGPLVSDQYVQSKSEPASGEWAREHGRVDASPQKSRYPERLSRGNSSAPPAQGRPDRAPLGLPDRRGPLGSPGSGPPPRMYGEAEIPSVPPAASSVRPRVWSRGTARPAIEFDTESTGLPRGLSRLMLLPLLLLGAGVVLTLVNGAYAAESGQVLMIGPVRFAWVAASAVFGGLGLAMYRLWARMG